MCRLVEFVQTKAVLKVLNVYSYVKAYIIKTTGEAILKMRLYRLNTAAGEEIFQYIISYPLRR